MTTGAAFSVINGQMVQTNLDGSAAHKEPVGTCINCGQTNVILSSHMLRSENVRYCCLSATQLPFIDANQSALPTNQKGAAPSKHR
jgi:hypothetical protein